MKIVIITDAWRPQVNGVVRTLEEVIHQLRQMKHEITIMYPTSEHVLRVPCPTYPEIQLSLGSRRYISKILDKLKPDCIHIATEGPLGWAARRYCVKHSLPFTTSFHTQFPEYIYARFGLPPDWIYYLLRRFHRASQRTMVTTSSMEENLKGKGFQNLIRWSRGVDTFLFKPGLSPAVSLPRPISLYVGRVAIEKNLESFLDLDLPGSKIVVGDGPQLLDLKSRFPQVHFTGARFGQELARFYNSADVFVFPSQTDTFGLVMLEALACGVPIAAYPVCGPLDIVTHSDIGCLDKDLKTAILNALKNSQNTKCREHALKFSWQASARQFLNNLYPIYDC